MDDIKVLRCPNFSCRIESFKGTLLIPLSNCPLCQFVGIPVFDPMEGRITRPDQAPECDGRCEDGRAVCTLWHGGKRQT